MAFLKKEEQKNDDLQEPLNQEEGELTVDIYETKENFIIRSPIGGVEAQDIEILLENDILIIKGKRYPEKETEPVKYLFRECYWGPFSKRIMLPEKVDISKSEAQIKRGILYIKLPKILETEAKKKIEVKEES